MATAITAHNPSTLQPSALSTLTWTASTAAGNEIVGSRRMLLLVRNAHAVTAKTFTVTSQADGKGRVSHITAQSLAAGAFAYVYLEDEGWLDSGRKLQLASEDNNIQWALINMGNL